MTDADVPEEVRLKNIETIRNQSQEIYSQCVMVDLPKVTCQCGRRAVIHYAYQCFHCGIYFCITCAPDHFGPDLTFTAPGG